MALGPVSFMNASIVTDVCRSGWCAPRANMGMMAGRRLSRLLLFITEKRHTRSPFSISQSTHRQVFELRLLRDDVFVPEFDGESWTDPVYVLSAMRDYFVDRRLWLVPCLFRQAHLRRRIFQTANRAPRPQFTRRTLEPHRASAPRYAEPGMPSS